MTKMRDRRHSLAGRSYLRTCDRKRASALLDQLFTRTFAGMFERQNDMAAIIFDGVAKAIEAKFIEILDANRPGWRGPMQPLTRQQWLDRCAARFVRRAAMEPEAAMHCAWACLPNRDDELDTPEDTADEELSHWTDDETETA